MVKNQSLEQNKAHHLDKTKTEKTSFSSKIKKELSKKSSNKCCREAYSCAIQGNEANFVCQGCEVSYIKGLFNQFGTASDPTKNYRLELVFHEEKICKLAEQILVGKDIYLKSTKRNNNFILYASSAERTSDFLAYIGANNAVLELFECVAEKQLSQRQNRAENMYAANIDKVMLASVEQIQLISDAERYIGMQNLPQKLTDLCVARLNFPNLSLEQLAKKLNISKSGISHRFAKLQELVEKKQRERKNNS